MKWSVDSTVEEAAATVALHAASRWRLVRFDGLDAHPQPEPELERALPNLTSWTEDTPASTSVFGSDQQTVLFILFTVL